jgi:hypothetical protein
VAGGTCCRKTGIYATSVALCACQPRMSAGEWESGEVMVERSRQPGGSGVTGGTGSPVAAVVLVIARMAGVTIGGSALVDAADMAGGAGHTGMCTGQLEGRQVMVEGGGSPGGGGMAGGAVGAELPLVVVVRGVTGVTVGGGALVDVANMAGGTGHTDMRPSQLKGGQVMVEGGGSPCERGMAEAAIGAEGTLVGIIGGVAGVTIDGCAGIDIARMASFARSLGMFPNQREVRPAMVEIGRSPTGGGMAGATSGTERTLMGVIRGVTGIAIGGCRLQVRDGAGSRMTGCAGDADMFACQLEWEQVMVKIASVGIDAIMARQAIAAKGKEMLSHEGCIHLFVADPACLLAEGADITAVAVAAKECSAGSGERVSSQGKAQRFVGKIVTGEIGQGSRRAAMVGMTIAAGESRVGLQDGSMHG